jgi:hypothetical protein
MREFNLDFPHETYFPHISISYDYRQGERYKAYPVPKFKIILDGEYFESLDKSWAVPKSVDDGV